MQAEMIVTNAKVLTMDEGRPRAEAVALAGGRILAVGDAAEVEALAGPGTPVIDAGRADAVAGVRRKPPAPGAGRQRADAVATGRRGGVRGAGGGVPGLCGGPRGCRC
jgi:hypothetical protein